MLEKLHGVEEKYLDLEAKLSDPDVVSDPEQYLKYAKAHAKLQEIVTVYREYKEQKALYDDDMAVAEENSDPELAEMAREEAESLNDPAAFARGPQRRQGYHSGDPGRGRRGRGGLVCGGFVPHVHPVCGHHGLVRGTDGFQPYGAGRF